MATLIKIFGPLIKNAVSMKSSASGSSRESLEAYCIFVVGFQMCYQFRMLLSQKIFKYFLINQNAKHI